MLPITTKQRAVMMTVVIIVQVAVDALAKYLVRREVRIKAEDQLGKE